MLVEIKCDEFKSKGTIRPTIEFSEGLNVVLGDSEASNSIGKSTFLLVVDFAFGGNSYVTKALDVQRHVGRHTIFFAFKFDDGIHYFSRDTVEYMRVSKCDEKYNKIAEITLEEFHNFLKEHYHLESASLTFRNAVSRYSRIYQKENLNEKQPLESSGKEPQRDAIRALLKLFGKIESIKSSLTARDNAATQYKTFTDSVKYQFIPSVTTKKELRQKESELIALEVKQNNLSDPESLKGKSADELLHIAEIKSELQKLRAARSRLQTKIQQLMQNLSEPHCDFQDDFQALQSFFPGIDMKKVSEIENFHMKLSSILRKEIEDALHAAETELPLVENDIAAREKELTSFDIPTGVSKSMLSEYAETTKQIDRIKTQIANFDKISSLKSNRDAYAEQYRNLLASDLRELQDSISTAMRELNDFVYAGKKKAPILLLSENSYRFETPDDTGTGTSYKGLVIYDLSVLKLTALPILIHDSLLLKNIGDAPIQKLLELYRSAGKQIFIALDKSNSYTDTATNILEESAILRLSKDGQELFGRSWSNVNQTDKE